MDRFVEAEVMEYEQRADDCRQAEDPNVQAPPPPWATQRQQADRSEAEPQGHCARDPRRRDEQSREHRAALEADDPAENQRRSRYRLTVRHGRQ